MAKSVSVGLSRFARLILAVLIAVGTVSVLSGCPKKQVKDEQMAPPDVTKMKQMMPEGGQAQTKSGKSGNPGMPGGTK